MPALKIIATPDAELLALGRQLDAAERDRREFYDTEDRRDAAKETACAAVGLPWVPPPDPGDAQAFRAWEIRERRRDMVCPGEDVDEEADCILTDRLFALLDRALALKAETLAGLQTQLRCFDLVMMHHVDDPHVRALFSAVCKFADVKQVQR